MRRLVTTTTTARTPSIFFGTYLILLCIILFRFRSRNEVVQVVQASDRAAEGRYSFSLTTFDPKGKLGQVERAQRASQLGPPLVAMALTFPSAQAQQLVVVAPQLLPSPLVLDDGTSRFLYLTPELIVTHSGLSADGRFLLSVAKRLATEHEYTFDEPIPVAVLLEELSLVYQQYTMKAAARPLGVTLLVGYLPSASNDINTDIVNNDKYQYKDTHNNTNESQHCWFILDPSGSVQCRRDPIVLLNGHLESSTKLRNDLERFLQKYHRTTKEKVDETEVVNVVKAALMEQLVKRGGSKATSTTSSSLSSLHMSTPNEEDAVEFPTILTASLTRDQYSTRRFEEEDSLS